MPDQPEPYKMPWEVPGESPNKPASILPQQQVKQDSDSNQPNQTQPNNAGHSTATIALVTFFTFIFSSATIFSAAAWIPLLLAIFRIEIKSISPEVGGGLIILIISGPLIITTLVAFAMSRPTKTQSSTSNTKTEVSSMLNKKFLIPIGIVLIVLILLLGLVISF